MISTPQSSPGPAPACPMPSGSGTPGSPARKRRTGSRLSQHAGSSSRALAMLTLLPIHATAVNRVHVEKRQPDGTLRVFDRPTGEHLLVYTPRFTEQFRAGHRTGRWYVRPLVYVGVRPQSPCFATARGAIEAVSAGSWSLSAAAMNRGRVPFRVIWPDQMEGQDTCLQREKRQNDPAVAQHLSSEQPS
jgi:hypothetical protein